MKKCRHLLKRTNPRRVGQITSHINSLLGRRQECSPGTLREWLSMYKSNRPMQWEERQCRRFVSALFRKRLDKNMINKGFGLWKPVENYSDLGSAQHLDKPNVRYVAT